MLGSTFSCFPRVPDREHARLRMDQATQSSLLVRSTHRQRGFSLLELMAALAVAALILGVGVPSFTTTVKDATIVSSANRLLSDMHHARSLAVTRNQRVTICPTTNGSACNTTNWAQGWLVFVDPNNDGALNSGEPIERVSEGTPGMSLQAFAFTNAITFRPNGRAMGATTATSTGAFLLCDDRGAPHARGIVIDPGGRPRVAHFAKLGQTAPCPT